MQTSIPSLFIHDGTPRRSLFLEDDLPMDTGPRNRRAFAVMGSPGQSQTGDQSAAYPLTRMAAICQRQRDVSAC